MYICGRSVSRHSMMCLKILEYFEGLISSRQSKGISYVCHTCEALGTLGFRIWEVAGQFLYKKTSIWWIKLMFCVMCQILMPSLGVNLLFYQQSPVWEIGRSSLLTWFVEANVLNSEMLLLLNMSHTTDNTTFVN